MNLWHWLEFSFSKEAFVWYMQDKDSVGSPKVISKQSRKQENHNTNDIWIMWGTWGPKSSLIDSFYLGFPFLKLLSFIFSLHQKIPTSSLTWFSSCLSPLSHLLIYYIHSDLLWSSVRQGELIPPQAFAHAFLLGRHFMWLAPQFACLSYILNFS